MENNDMQFVDVSEPKKKDKFMIGIIISLVILFVLGLLIYFFGYDLFKGFIKV